MARYFFSALATAVLVLSVSSCTRSETSNTVATDQTSTTAAADTAATIVEQTATPSAATSAIETVGTAPASTVAESSGTVIGHADGDTAGTRLDIYELHRTSGDTVTLKFAIVNNSEKEVGGYDYSGGAANDYSTLSGVHLLEPTERTQYSVMRDPDKKCVCSTGVNIKKGEQKHFWAKFPAPPASSTKLTVVVPHFEPVEDVPIS